MPEFKPHSAGQIIDQAIRMYKNNFVRFMTIVAIVYVPIFLVQFAMQNLPTMMRNMESGTSVLGIIIMFVGLLVGVLLFFLGQSLANAALVAAVSNQYLGKPITVGEAYGTAIPKLLPIIIATILTTIIVMFGFVLLVVPGVIFTLWFTMVSPAIIVENLGALDSMKRSRNLARGNLSKIFFILLAMFLIGMIVSWGFAGITYLITGQAFASPNAAITTQFVAAIMNLIAQLLVAPIGGCAIILLYYDLRIRKEGFDLEMMAHSIGQGTPANPEPNV